MNKSRFAISFIIMLMIQLVLSRYCQGTYLYLCILPAMILCLPTSCSTPLSMIIAFASGILVDGLSDGVLGLNAAAAVPVALLQKPLIRLFIDDDIVERKYAFSFRENGHISIGLALLVCEVVFFLIYVIADSAGCRGFGFNLLKTGVSILTSFVPGMLVVNVLAPKQKR